MTAAYGQYRNQILVLRAIRDHVAELGEFPRQVKICAALGVDAPVVAAAFQWLRFNAYIERIGHGEYRLTEKTGEPSPMEHGPRWVPAANRYAHLLRGVTMTGYGVSR